MRNLSSVLVMVAGVAAGIGVGVPSPGQVSAAPVTPPGDRCQAERARCQNAAQIDYEVCVIISGDPTGGCRRRYYEHLALCDTQYRICRGLH